MRNHYLISIIIVFSQSPLVNGDNTLSQNRILIHFVILEMIIPVNLHRNHATILHLIHLQIMIIIIQILIEKLFNPPRMSDSHHRLHLLILLTVKQPIHKQFYFPIRLLSVFLLILLLQISTRHRRQSRIHLHCLQALLIETSHFLRIDIMFQIVQHIQLRTVLLKLRQLHLIRFGQILSHRLRSSSHFVQAFDKAVNRRLLGHFPRITVRNTVNAIAQLLQTLQHVQLLILIAIEARP
mmetsp:Transcript_45054/g.72007  ORF Transcript_45054/g.72007 Transcript_45054/m.72007 type:complete len:239 (+) Transcript_45054:21-737(+)